MKRRAKQNQWGNWKGYEGKRLAHDFGTDEQAAKTWAAGGDLPKFEREAFKMKIGKPQVIRQSVVCEVDQDHVTRPVMVMLNDGTVRRVASVLAAKRLIEREDAKLAKRLDKQGGAMVITMIDWRGLNNAERDTLGMGHMKT